MSNTPTETQSLQILRSYVNQLHEHLDADSVQVFATKTTPSGETVQMHHGVGNFYSRLGFIECWLASEKAITTEHALEQLWLDVIDEEDSDEEDSDDYYKD